MNHASSYVNFADSDDEDYVEMDDDDMATGLQSIAAPAAMRAPPPIGASSGPAAPPPPGSAAGGLFGRLAGYLPSAAVTAPPTSSVSSIRDRVRSKKMARSGRRGPQRRQNVRRKVNTNVVSVDLGTLGAAASQIATGDPVFCRNENCRTIMASTNELIRENDDEHKLDEGELMWVCHFCGTKNVCDMDEEEKPAGESQDYILEPPTAEAKSEDDNIVVFCVDVSGSMCVSQEVQGKVKLRGNRLAELQALNDDGSNQFTRGQKRNTTYVSRLQSVQAAIDDQLTALAKDRPRQRVALVTFSNDVTILGDGTVGAALVVTGDKLFNLEQCKTDGGNYRMNLPIGEAREQLSTALWDLEEKGQTALGPALTVSVAIASQRRGSSVILCTDGLANIGLGSLEVDEDQEEAVAEWYEEMGNWALTNGVTVNIVSITDDGCQLENLGKVADLSGGEVQRINPFDLAKNFQGILEKPVLATNVQARMFIHPGLKFRSDTDDRMDVMPVPRGGEELQSAMSLVDENVESGPLSADAAVEDVVIGDASNEASEAAAVVVQQQVQDVGNVFGDSQLFFEYDIIRERLGQYEHLDGLPFQVQIDFTRLDGAKMRRVITQMKPISTSREEVLRQVDFSMLGHHAQRKTARLCEEGDYEAARVVTYSNAAWMASNAQSAEHEYAASGYMDMNLDLDGMMQEQQRTEARSGYSHSGVSRTEKKRKRKKARKGNDAMSAKMYVSKSSSRY